MDALTLFGLFAVSAMLVCYALESRSHWFVLLFAGSCALGSALRFSSGSLAVWSGRGDLVDCRNTALAYGAEIGRSASITGSAARSRQPKRAVELGERGDGERLWPCWRACRRRQAVKRPGG